MLGITLHSPNSDIVVHYFKHNTKLISNESTSTTNPFLQWFTFTHRLHAMLHNTAGTVSLLCCLGCQIAFSCRYLNVLCFYNNGIAILSQYVSADNTKYTAFVQCNNSDTLILKYIKLISIIVQLD